MKKAFTLAEVLIALVIIGVISAVTMMQIREMADEQNILMYKRTFTTLQEVVSRIAGDQNLFPFPNELGLRYGKIEREDESEGNRETRWARSNTPEDAQYFCVQLTNRLETLEFDDNGDRLINCAARNGRITDANFVQNILLSNGAQLAGLGQVFSDDNNLADFEEAFIDICIDTNGEAGPNNGCDAIEAEPILRRDRFRIRIDYTGRITTNQSWRLENEILDSENNPADLNSEDFPDEG